MENSATGEFIKDLYRMYDRLSDAIYDFEHARSNTGLFLNRLNRQLVEAQILLRKASDLDLESMVQYVLDGKHLKNKRLFWNRLTIDRQRKKPWKHSKRTILPVLDL